MQISQARPGLVPFIAAGAMFMENLDATVITTALPAMAIAFGATTTSVSLGISGYMLAVAICIPLSGWLADRWGTRTVLCSAIALFTLASVLCGLCDTLGGFVACRVLQGAAAALMTPVARLVVVRNTAKADLMRAIAIITWPALVAPVLGPPIGGFFTVYASWRWIFYMNIPIGTLGVLLAWRYVAEHRLADHKPFDFFGFALVASALSALMLGLQWLGGEGGWGIGAGLLLAGAVLGGFALRHAAQSAHPVFSLAATRVQSFAATTLGGGFLSRLSISALPFLLPLLFQVAFGLNAFVSGLMVLGYFVGNIAMKLLVTRIVRALGFRQVLVANGLALAMSVWLCAALRPGWPTIAVATALLVGGACRSLQMTALNSLAFADVPAEHTSGANTLSSLVQQMANATGVALAAGLLQLSLGLRGGGSLALQDFQIAFIGVGAFSALAVFSYVKLPPTTGAQVSGHTSRTASGHGRDSGRY